MNTTRNVSLAITLVLWAGVACNTIPRVEQGAASHSAGRLLSYTSDSSGFDTRSYYYDTGSEVVVVDAQFTETLAQKLIEEIRAHTRSSIRYLVITHPNPDKFNGAEAFRRIGAKVVASRATAEAIPGVHAYKKGYFVEVAKMFEKGSYPAEATVDITYEGQLTLDLAGGAVVSLHELENPGVSSTQTVIHIPAERALVVGDLVHHGAHAWLEGGIVDGNPRPDLAAWKAALDELQAFPGTTVYGGRGKSAPVEEAVDTQRSYLDVMAQLVRDYVVGLGERTAELSSSAASEHYKAIRAEAAKRFPERNLPYLVEFGVYGLVNQLVDQKD